MAGDRYLTKRSGIFYFQMAVPDYVRPHVAGKRLWRHSLRTGDVREASLRARPFIDYYTDVCDRYRPIPVEKQAEVTAMMGALGFDRKDGRQWDAHNINDAKAVLEAEMAKALTEFRAKLSALTEQVGQADAEALMRDGDTGREFQRRQETIMTALTGVDMVAAELRGETPEEPVEAAEPVTTLHDLCDRWARRADVVELTVSEMKTTIRRFYELVGEKDIRHITTDDVWAFYYAVEDMPRHMNEQMRALPLPALLKSLQGTEYERVSTRTLNKRISNIRTLLGVDKRLVPVNPADPVKVAKGKAMKRLPFDRDDFTAMMSVAPFATNQRNHKLFWPVLLGMFTGARIGEIASLRAGDIKQDSGHWYIDLLDDPDSGRRFKTEASRRHVPIHPELIRMGFVEWAQKQKGLLFPTFKPYQGKHGHYLSKDFGRWLRDKSGITDSRKVFHSFRHKMKDALRAAEVSDTLQEAILGHEGRTVGDSYGDGYELPTKAAAMSRVSIPVTLPT